MKQVYIIVDRKKVFVDVSEEVAQALADTRQAEWREEAKERYYHGASIDAMNDSDERLLCDATNPETVYITTKEHAERKAKMIAALNSLTAEQQMLVRLLRKGKSVTEIADQLGVTKSAVSNMRIRIQKKFKEFLS